MSLRDIVFENLNHAKENGYFDDDEQLFGATPEEIANDMIAYADDCYDISREDLIPHIKEWLNEKLRN